MMNQSHGNQQPSSSRKAEKVQRLSRKGVEPSGSKREASAKADDEIVCAALERCRRPETANPVATIQYANISTYALQTAIDPALEALGVQMAYRLAQLINTILQNTANGANAVDPLVGSLSLPPDQLLANTDITTAVQSLQGVNALPFEDGRYFGVMSPITVGNVLVDDANNSLTDVIKRTAQGNERLKELPAPDGDAVTVIDWGGATFFQSTFVTQTPNYETSGQTAMRSYIVGKDGVIGISFGAKENTQIGDGNWRNLNVWVRRLTEPSGYDPSRMIGGFASYNTMYTATLPPDPVQRIRYIDAVTSTT